MAAYSNEALPEEIERADKKFKKRDAGIVKAEGEGASARSRAIASKWLPVLTEGLTGTLKARNDNPELRTFFALVEKLDRPTLALCLLQEHCKALDVGTTITLIQRCILRETSTLSVSQRGFSGAIQRAPTE